MRTEQIPRFPPARPPALRRDQIWSRLPPQLVPRSLRAVDPDASDVGSATTTTPAAALMARTAAAINISATPSSSHATFTVPVKASDAWGGAGRRGNGSGSTLLLPTTASVPVPAKAPSTGTSVSAGASTAYGSSVRACEACFALHQTEASLVRAERRLAAAVGAPIPTPGGRGRAKTTAALGGRGEDGEYGSKVLPFGGARRVSRRARGRSGSGSASAERLVGVGRNGGEGCIGREVSRVQNKYPGSRFLQALIFGGTTTFDCSFSCFCFGKGTLLKTCLVRAARYLSAKIKLPRMDSYKMITNYCGRRGVGCLLCDLGSEL